MTEQTFTPAQRKAIDAGGTNNTVIGNSLVKRGVFRPATEYEREILSFHFVLVQVLLGEAAVQGPALRSDEDPIKEFVDTETLSGLVGGEPIEAKPIEPGAFVKAYEEALAKKRTTRDPNATKYEDIPKWTDDRLVMKYKELHARLGLDLPDYDRKLTENRCQRVEDEIIRRDITYRLR